METVIEKTKLGDMRHKAIGKLSKGYKQRVGIAQAILGNPKVIILDEPTIGLDPIQIIEIRDLIKELGEEHTVIFSSHILSEVQAICDKILIISKGKLIAFDDADNLEKTMTQTCSITFVAQTDAQTAHDLLWNNEHIEAVSFLPEKDGYVEGNIQTAFDDIKAVCKEIFMAFAEVKIPLVELKYKKANIEDIFIELAGATDTEDTDNDAPENEELPFDENTEESEDKEL